MLSGLMRSAAHHRSMGRYSKPQASVIKPTVNASTKLMSNVKQNFNNIYIVDHLKVIHSV